MKAPFGARKLEAAQAVASGKTSVTSAYPCKHGHTEFSLDSKCIQCKRDSVVKWRSDNPDKAKESELRAAKKWYKINPDKSLESDRNYKKNNPESVKAKGKRWADKNPLNSRMRHHIHRCLKGIHKVKTVEILGYSQTDLMAHIESLWLTGMSWENRAEWHIDHIVPVSWFLSNGIDDPKVINNLNNLTPLWSNDNLSKSSKWTLEISETEYLNNIRNHNHA